LKKFFFVFVLIAAAIILFLFTYEYKSKQEQFFYTYTLSDKEISLIQDGDIILRHGYGFVSDVIVKRLNEEYDISHCAIITKKDNKFIVIHSVSRSLSDYDGVQSQDFKSFVKESKKNSIIIVRYKDKNADVSKIGERAKYYLAKQVPFDNSFDITDDKEIYCNELIWKIFKEEYNHDIYESVYEKSKHEHLKFATFLDTSKFEVIINHHKSL